MPNSVLLFQMNFDQHTASDESAYDHHINLFLMCLLVLDFASKLTLKCFNLYHEIKKLDYCVRNPQPQNVYHMDDVSKIGRMLRVLTGASQ